MSKPRKRLVLIGLICTTGCTGSGQIARQVDPHLHTAAVAASVQQAENSAKNVETLPDGESSASQSEGGFAIQGAVRQVEYSDDPSELVEGPPAAATPISIATAPFS